METDEAIPVTTEKEKVQSVIQAFFEAMDTQDMERISALTAHDAKMVHFGTDRAERWVGWKELKEVTAQMFEGLESYEVEIRDQVIRIADTGRVAWFSQVIDSHVTTKSQEVHTEDARFTGVLEKRSGSWVFVQTHLSLPVSGQHVAY